MISYLVETDGRSVQRNYCLLNKNYSLFVVIVTGAVYAISLDKTFTNLIYLACVFKIVFHLPMIFLLVIMRKY